MQERLQCETGQVDSAREWLAVNSNSTEQTQSPLGRCRPVQFMHANPAANVTCCRHRSRPSAGHSRRAPDPARSPCVVACRSIGHVSQPPRFPGLDAHAAVGTVLLRTSIRRRYPRGYAVHHAWTERCSLLGFSAQPPARLRSSTSACSRCGFRSRQRGEGRRRRGIGYILRTTEYTTCGYDSSTSPTRAQALFLLFVILSTRSPQERGRWDVLTDPKSITINSN
jgi:hypothetical protein